MTIRKTHLTLFVTLLLEHGTLQCGYAEADYCTLMCNPLFVLNQSKATLHWLAKFMGRAYSRRCWRRYGQNRSYVENTRWDSNIFCRLCDISYVTRYESDTVRIWNNLTYHLGYDPEAKNPYYGKPDQEVSDKVSFWFFIFMIITFLLVQCMVERARWWCAECSTRSWYRTRFIIIDRADPSHGPKAF